MTISEPTQSRYYVVFMTTNFSSLADVQQEAPAQLAAHIARSAQLHADGVLLMAGAFLDPPDQPVHTMGVLVSREAAEDYAKHDPFVVNGTVSHWVVREWTNIFQRAGD
jgi:uncharacterized protein YciI